MAGPAVVLWLFPPPVDIGWLARVPAGWLEPAVDWVAAGLGEHDRVWGSVGTVPFPLTVGQAREFVAAKHACEDFGAWVVAGDYPHRFRAVSGAFFGTKPRDPHRGCLVSGRRGGARGVALPGAVAAPRRPAGRAAGGARLLADGRLAVCLGEPADWLLDSLPAPRRRLSQLDGCRRDPQVQQRARQTH